MQQSSANNQFRQDSNNRIANNINSVQCNDVNTDSSGNKNGALDNSNDNSINIDISTKQRQTLVSSSSTLSASSPTSGSSATNNNNMSITPKKELPANGKKTKGRVRIKMEFIHNKLRRYTTFSKRKTGIMKKVSNQ